MQKQSKQFVGLDFRSDEAFASMQSEIIKQGSVAQKQTMEVIQIETDLDETCEFDEYLTYSLEE